VVFTPQILGLAMGFDVKELGLKKKVAKLFLESEEEAEAEIIEKDKEELDVSV
jgi:hypothetical protein